MADRLPLEDVSTPGHGQGEGPIVDGRGRSERSERSSDSGSTVYRRAKLIYIVPDFCNPSGVTMSLEERQALVEFARREDLLIVEDSPYRELRYSGTDIPTIYSLAQKGPCTSAVSPRYSPPDSVWDG